ncbi:MAG: AIR synthase-related protein [Patescibacteria group bacterium]
MYNPVKPYKHEILKSIERTWRTPYVEVARGVYPLIKKKATYAKYAEVDHTDGIGTKGFYHWKAGTFRAAVLDALAMNLNDLALVRAVPYKMSNHITVPAEDVRVFKIIQAMVEECKKRRIAMVGGENSFHNTSDGLDISMTVSGFVKKPQPNLCKAGDVLIGLKSSGLHSNGITTVRKVFKNQLRPEFTVPTKIYLDEVLAVCGKCQVNGMMHITGGAFTKLKDILKGADAEIVHPRALKPQKIFFDLRKKIPNKQMYSTFNCGIGFVLSVPKREVEQVLRLLPASAPIGRVVKGTGKVGIVSAFDGKTIAL